jgi:hypothetical protein
LQVTQAHIAVDDGWPVGAEPRIAIDYLAESYHAQRV